LLHVLSKQRKRYQEACAANDVFGSNTYVYSAEGGYGYKSWDGVLSEQAWNSAMAMRQRASNPQMIMEMRRLEDKWAEYE